MITAKLTKAEAGRLGGRAKWAGYVPKVVRLDSLSEAERRLVLALIAAKKAAAEADKPAGQE